MWWWPEIPPVSSRPHIHRVAGIPSQPGSKLFRFQSQPGSKLFRFQTQPGSKLFPGLSVRLDQEFYKIHIAEIYRTGIVLVHVGH